MKRALDLELRIGTQIQVMLLFSKWVTLDFNRSHSQFPHPLFGHMAHLLVLL